MPWGLADPEVPDDAGEALPTEVEAVVEFAPDDPAEWVDEPQATTNGNVKTTAANRLSLLPSAGAERRAEPTPRGHRLTGKIILPSLLASFKYGHPDRVEIQPTGNLQTVLPIEDRQSMTGQQ